MSSSSSSEGVSATDEEDQDHLAQRLGGSQQDMPDVLGSRRHKYQGGVNQAIYYLWRAIQGDPPNDELVWLPDELLLEVYLNDRSLAMSEITDQQQSEVVRFLGQAWATIRRQRPWTHPANVLARRLAAADEARRVEKAIALAEGHHERLGTGSLLQSLDPGVVRMIAVFAKLAAAEAEEEPK